MEVRHMAGSRASDVQNKAQSTNDSTCRLWLASERKSQKREKREVIFFLSQDIETWADPTEPRGGS